MRLCRPGRLRLGGFAGLIFRKRLCADDHILRGQSHNYCFGYQQHVELGDNGSDEHCHYAGDVYVHIGERFDERKPDGNDHLHVDGDQCCRLDNFHGYGNRQRKLAEQASHQLLYG